MRAADAGVSEPAAGQRLPASHVSGFSSSWKAEARRCACGAAAPDLAAGERLLFECDCRVGTAEIQPGSAGDGINTRADDPDNVGAGLEPVRGRGQL